MKFQLLGPVLAYGNGGAVSLGRRRERLLLGILLLEPRRPVSANRLIDLLWDDEPPPRSRAPLHTSAARLRRTLSPHGVAVRGSSAGYAIDADADSVDAHEFADAVVRAKALRDPAARADALARALALWRGPFLADTAGEPLSARLGATLDEIRIDATQFGAEAELKAGRPERAIASLVRLVDLHPTRERLAGLLMEALYATGRMSDALDVYRRVRLALVGELGTEPGPDLHRLHVQILSRDPALPSTRREPITLARPSGRARRTGATPRELPMPNAHFIGRRAERAHAISALTTAGEAPPQVVAVYGLAGVGKSSLAINVAHCMTTGFPDGQLYVDMHGSIRGVRPRTPLEVLRRCMLTLGVRHRDIPAIESDAAAMWRSVTADRSLLLLLDNVHDSAQIRPLLPAAGSSRALITSRQHLADLDGSVHINLDVMTDGDAQALLVRLGCVGSDAIAEIADRCGNLPLALRIVGMRNAVDDTADLATRLRDSRELLNELDFGGLSVRQCFADSYLALAESSMPRERRAARIFRLFGLPMGPTFTAPLVAATIGESLPATRRSLDRLVQVGLVHFTPHHYQLHKLVRLVAAERADDELPAAERKMLVDRAGGTRSREISREIQALGAA